MLVAIAFLIGLTLIIYSCATPRRIATSALFTLLSSVVNLYLVLSKPIYSLDRRRQLPTCPYQWPNGQGDIGKFLEGEKNSSRWRDEHGRIYRIWSGFKSEIVLTHPDDVESVFKDSNRHVKAENGNAGWLMGELLGSCVGLLNGVQWTNVHNVFAADFSRKSAVDQIPLISSAVERHFVALEQSGSLTKGTFHPVHDFRMLPFWIVAEMIYGELSEVQREQLKDLIPLRESVFMRMLLGGSTRFWWSQYLPHRVTKDLRTFQTKWNDFNKEAYKADQMRQGTSLISALFQAVSRDELSWKGLLQTLDEMLFANLDVTIGGLSWNFYFLAKHQDVQSVIRDELASHKATSDPITSWKEYITSTSTLLAASILESARLRPVAPFTVPQSAPSSRDVGGYWIPAGTNFIVDTKSLNTHKSVWGEDSTRYRPSRFNELSSSATRYSSWRFGFGPRQCMGRYAADIILRATIARLLGQYSLSLPSRAQGDSKLETWTSQPDMEIHCAKLT